MANFVSIPVIDSEHMEANPPTGIPFTQQALKIANGYWAGTEYTGVYGARVGNVFYFVSAQSDRHGLIWQQGYVASGITPFPLVSSGTQFVYLTSSIGVPFGTYSIDVEPYSTREELIAGFYSEIVNPDSGGGGGGGGANEIVVSVIAAGADDKKFEVTVNAYYADADEIKVTVSAFDKYTEDPFAPGGISQNDVPEGTFDDTSDPVHIQAIPDVSAAGSGLITLFKPTLSELTNLGNYLWTRISDFIENLQKLFVNPMDYLIALNIVPCSPATGARRDIYIGNWATDISMAPILSQWDEFNCGSIKIANYSGTALDYAPNTKITAMLPFIGSVQLNTDEVMGQTLGLVYRFDLLSGNCVAMITVNGDVIYQFTGEAAVPVPLTGSDWSRVYSAIVGSVAAVGIGVAGAGLAGATAGGAQAAVAASKATNAGAYAGMAFSQINSTSKGIPGVQAMRNNMVELSQLALEAGKQTAANASNSARSLQALRMTNTIGNVATSVMGAKGHVTHSGSISGSAGILGNRIPYVLIEYPNQSLPEGYKHYVGYPSNVTKVLGTLRGYTECEQVYLSNIEATDSEVAEILEALKGGVYL